MKRALLVASTAFLLACPGRVGEPPPAPDAGPQPPADGGPADAGAPDVAACEVADDGSPATGERVTFRASSTAPATAGAAVVDFSWRLVAAPPNTLVALPDGTAESSVVLPAHGGYTAEVVIRDDAGGERIERCSVRAIPDFAVSVQLSWDASFGDLDVHLFKKDSQDRFCGEGRSAENGSLVEACGGAEFLSCFYANCRGDSVNRPAWDDDAAAGSDGDPELILDDLCGYGPELVQIPALEPGEYLVGVDFFGFTGCQGSGDVEASVDIFVAGQARARLSRALSDGEFWESAIIVVGDDGEVCVRDVASAEESCAPAPGCEPAGACAECEDDEGCGFGLVCAEDFCDPAPGCELDDECADQRQCSAVTSSCVQPECGADGDCGPDESCDLEALACILGPAECAEGDEPNDDTGSALALTDEYAGAICRGDVDVFGFDVEVDKRYTLVVDFAQPPGPDEVYRLSVVTADSISTLGEVSAPNAQLQLQVVAPEDGQLFAVVDGGGLIIDQVGYTLALTEGDVLPDVDCDAEVTAGIEPNDEPGDAHEIAGDTDGTFSRCGIADEDWYRIAVPALNGLAVEVEHELADGDLEVDLFREGDLLNPVDSSRTPNAVEQVAGPEGEAAYLVRVALFSGFGALDDQPYELRTALVPRPADCDADVNEPDPQTPPALAVGGSIVALRCREGDTDTYRLTVPAGQLATVRLAYTGGPGALAIDQLDEAGDLVAVSTAAVGAAILALPLDPAEQTYDVRVRGTGLPAVSYTISLEAADAAECLIHEPQPNDTLGTAASITPPVASPGLGACAAADTITGGCGHTCGPDDVDWVSLGQLEIGQVIRASLSHTAADGVLGLAVGRLTSGGADFIVENERNTGAADDISVSFTVVNDTRDHGVRVRSQGGASLVQPYALSVAVSCARDESENDTPADAVQLARNGTDPLNANQAGSACADDVDVYELISLPGETVTATLTATSAATVEIGTRPANLGDDAVQVAAGVAGAATFNNDALQLLYVTVRADPDTDAGGYTLAVTTN
jgi:hypothetical protein